jgi:hypothetical protein
VALDFSRELGTPILNLISNILVLRRQANSAAPGTTPGTVPATPAMAFDPYRDTEALRQHARAMNAQPAASPSQGPTTAGTASQPGAPAAGTAQAPSATAPPNELLLLLQNYGGLILNALNNGMPGYDFADCVARLVGTGTIAAIANHGEDLLSQSMLSLPEFQMFGESRLKKFAYEFVHFEELMDADEEDDHEQSETQRTSD